MSVLGRMLGYGRLEVEAAGAQGAEVLNHLPNPGTFRDQVFMQSEKRRGRGTPGGPAALASHPGGGQFSRRPPSAALRGAGQAWGGASVPRGRDARFQQRERFGKR